MEESSGSSSKMSHKTGDRESRAHSQDTLDTSSASSLSVFIDHPETHSNNLMANDPTFILQKSEESSPRASMDEALKSEKAFIEFVMSLPSKEMPDHHRSADSVSVRNKTPVSGVSTSKVGLDHLDNLCKLMEQLSDLRDTNSKLQKRVQYLEDLKTLHDMHKEICDEGQYSSEDALSSKPQAYELKKSATVSCCPKKEELHIISPSRGPSKYLSRRSRNLNTSGPRRGRSKSVGHEDVSEDTKSRRIFPKWSKVKEAFGWESERKESVKMKVNNDSLQIPRRCSDEAHQSLRHPGSPTWYQEYVSLHSSVEDINADIELGRWKRTSDASEKYVPHLTAPSEGLQRQKSTPSPGSNKISPYREHPELKAKSATIERDSYTHQDISKFDKDDNKRGKSPWGRVKTIIERRRDSLKRRSLHRDQSYSECEPCASKADALDFKTYSEYVESSLKQPDVTESLKHKGKVPTALVLDQEGDFGGLRTPSSSPTLHRKSRWTRVKKVLKGKKEEERETSSQSTPATPVGVQDGNFSFDAIEEISQDSYEEEREIARVGSDSHVHQLPLTAETSDIMLQLQRNLSEDFNRKIQEWERMRAGGNASCSPQWDRKPSEAIRTRKKSERGDKAIKPKLKDLTWLEKELQKIEKEKQRLSKERQKYEERALRLQKLKETVLSAKNSNKREVLVRTSAGEFRFEGISDAFTKKLYEWETKRGLGPELSTIALLDASRLTVQPSLGPKPGSLQRVISRSESSMVDIGQPSHNSSNSLPSLKLPDSLESERQNQPSRANSEPDLSALAALANGANVTVSTLTRHTVESLEDEITNPEVSKESEEDELEKRREDSETYYGLLEENVILLEQLKDKEDICRRLEKELEMLDEKVDVMNSHHIQETERYREKLWEMHKPGATPRDVQCCLRTMAQLKKRIETLEMCTEKLRNDRESVEDSFRYHSKQQEHMTLDLLEKMRELQAVGSSTDNGAAKSVPSDMDASTVERLQDLSALLVKQTQDLEETLSEKTRQICQLRWELLHRDLSTIKLETELHTHTVHRKRSKYAHLRSHSSEEASACPISQELDFCSRNVATEAYCSVKLPNDFQATELSNTVQQLNMEVQKLTTGAENSPRNSMNAENLVPSTNAENSRPGNISINCTKGAHVKEITVRRSSAENISLTSGDGNHWKQGSSSSDSDGSSEDSYARVEWHTVESANISATSEVERLLLSHGEHPPRGYAQRKKLQKISRSNLSPVRKRSNTFHTDRDFVKSTAVGKTPPKFQSFRVPRENCLENCEVKNVPNSSLNIQNLYSNLRKAAKTNNYQHLLQSIPLKNDISEAEAVVNTNCVLLREVASDSKIPFLIQMQHYVNEKTPGEKCACKHPIRSMSDKQRKETAAERREHFQKKRFKRRFKSPDSSNANKTIDVLESDRSKNYSENKISNRIGDKCLISEELSSHGQEAAYGKTAQNRVLESDKHSTETATVTIQLPKRRLGKALRHVENAPRNEEQIFTIVIPRKRSLSSEQDSSISESSARETLQFTQEHRNDNCENSGHQNKTFIHSLGDHCAIEIKNESTASDSHKSLYTNDCDTRKEVSQNEQVSRKRKAEDIECSITNIITNTTNDALIPRSREEFPQTHPIECIESGPIEKHSHATWESDSVLGYTKSPSAPQLDWRKMCAKKISSQGAPNVRTLIEKYNQKVIGSQAPTSPVSSNVSSPAGSRKVSAPVYSCRETANKITHSSSTPNTPNIISASAFYNPLVFKPKNLDLFPKSPPASPISIARSEALRKAKENFIVSPPITLTYHRQSNQAALRSSSAGHLNSEQSVNPLSDSTNPKSSGSTNLEEDTISNSSMDSISLMVFRTGENCKESRLSKRSADCQRHEIHKVDKNNLKTSKSLSNSSLFKTVLSSDFKIPASLLKLRRSKRKKDMSTVSQLCRQSLLLTTEDSEAISGPASHKSCPSSPELKSKNAGKPSWFHRNIFRHK